jgi:hypothetical protein
MGERPEETAAPSGRAVERCDDYERYDRNRSILETVGEPSYANSDRGPGS